MSRRPALVLILLALFVAGCGREPGAAEEAAAPKATLAPLPEDFQGEWRGLLPCADCEGIDTALLLQRHAGQGRFELVERYLGGPAAGEYRSEGEWREQPCESGGEAGLCLWLDGPGLRWFRHADGSLTAIDGEGRALDADGSRLRRL